MKNKLILLIGFLSIFSSAFSQNALTLSFGKILLSEKTYFSDGFSIDAGHQFFFSDNFVLQSTIGITKLNQNIKYTYSDESSIDERTVSFIEGMQPEILYTSFYLKENIGIVFFKQSRIQPMIFSGVSGNYIMNSYTNPGDLTQNTFIINTKKNNQMVLGFHSSAGVRLKITDNLNIHGFAEYNFQPSSKIGIQQLKANSLGLFFGISFSL